MEEWRVLTHLGYPNYEVSNQGRIRNTKSGRLVKAHPNGHGIYHVGLYSHGTRTNYSVGKLVGLMFLPIPENENFDTITHRDGRNHNNYYWNLEWRPRWFAVKYNQEYHAMESFPKDAVAEDTTGLIFRSGREAASYFCLLEEDVHKACQGGPPPIFGRDLLFRYSEEEPGDE